RGRRREGQQRPVPRRRRSAATPAAGPLPLPSPQRRAAEEAAAPSSSSPVSPHRRPRHPAARRCPRLPIDDGGEVDGDGGDGGATLPSANKSPSSSSSGALDGDAAEAEARRRLTSSLREALGLYRDILRVTWLFEWPDDRGDYDGIVTEYDVECGVLVWERDEHEGRRVWATARHRPVLFALTLATAAVALPFSPRAPAAVAPPPPSSLPSRLPTSRRRFASPRNRLEREKWKRREVMMWLPSMWGPRGSHADSAAT
ncbi:Os03g0643900, partial [Oryza sativa Japonica Group]